MEIVTNPNKRCFLCQGREVRTLDKGVISFNLKSIGDDTYACKDGKECLRNRIAEQTKFSFNEEGKIMKVEQYEKTLLEVDYEIQKRR